MAKPRNKRSLTIARHRTSISLEEAFWTELSALAKADGKSIAVLVGEIDKRRGEVGSSEASLSSAVRLYVLERLRGKSEAPHKR
jgi:predicted DNA-binding ribbon-helix-helix protein